MIRIRSATEADFAALLQVQQAAFGEYATVYEVSAWTTETLDSLRQDAKDKRILVAEAEGESILMPDPTFQCPARGREALTKTPDPFSLPWRHCRPASED